VPRNAVVTVSPAVVDVVTERVEVSPVAVVAPIVTRLCAESSLPPLRMTTPATTTAATTAAMIHTR
jgi:hypothetical protein